MKTSPSTLAIMVHRAWSQRTTLLFALLAAGIALTIACGGGSSSTTETATPGLSPTPGTTPTAEAAAVNHRTDCEVIRGTPFQNPEEGTWYAANCSRFDGPPVAAAGANQVMIGDTLTVGGASINAPIARATVPESGQMPDPVGYFNAVWYDFSKFEGYGGYAKAGNLILSGHVDCARCQNGGSGTAIFWNVRNMKAGDTAQYKLADGTVLNYVVTGSRDISPNDDWTKIVASDAADMTLITCTGNFVGGEYSLRHVVSLKKT